jgi:hypothetical protein
MPCCVSCGVIQHPLPEELQLPPAIPTALDPLQALAGAVDRPVRPRERHGGRDGGLVPLEPVDEGRSRHAWAGLTALEPGIQGRPLPPARLHVGACGGLRALCHAGRRGCRPLRGVCAQEPGAWAGCGLLGTRWRRGHGRGLARRQALLDRRIAGHAQSGAQAAGRGGLRAPDAPPASLPRARPAAGNRPGRCAWQGASPGQRAAKGWRGHVGGAQRTRRPWQRRRTGGAATGRARRGRGERRGTGADAGCQAGPVASGGLARAATRRRRAAVETGSPPKPGRRKGSSGGNRPAARPHTKTKGAVSPAPLLRWR